MQQKNDIMEAKHIQLNERLGEMEKIVGKIVDDGVTCKDFVMMAAISAIEYEIMEAKKKAEK